MEEKIIEKLSIHEFVIVCIIELIMFFQCCLIFLAWLFEIKNNIIGISLGTSLIVLFIFYIVYLKVNSFNNKKSDILEVFEEDEEDDIDIEDDDEDELFGLIKTLKTAEKPREIISITIKIIIKSLIEFFQSTLCSKATTRKKKLLKINSIIYIINIIFGITVIPIGLFYPNVSIACLILFASLMFTTTTALQMTFNMSN